MTDDRRPALVSLVGAGPGDPLLITIGGVARLAEADVVVYDRLANPALLAHARAGAELIDAGKMPDRHALTQDQINATLVEHGLAGKRVVRLKGGDPFVFGRGGEEAEALIAAGVPFEVIPGVTSSIAAPAYAGIPVTHRGIATSFAVVTGHEEPSKDETSINWAQLATGVDTLVFLMGVGRLEQIVARLVENGRAASDARRRRRVGHAAAPARRDRHAPDDRRRRKRGRHRFARRDDRRRGRPSA